MVLKVTPPLYLLPLSDAGSERDAGRGRGSGVCGKHGHRAMGGHSHRVPVWVPLCDRVQVLQRKLLDGTEVHT